MLYRLSNHSFIREFSEFGYILSNLTKHDRVYNYSGKYFLKTISREIKDFKTGLNEISEIFYNTPVETLKNDYKEFLEDLAKDHYIVMGETKEELDKNELHFTYTIDNPKTLARDFFDNDRDEKTKESQEALGKYFRENPKIFSFQIEITSRCNERCIHCYIPHENKINDIKPELYYNVLDQLADMGTLSLTISGGECFIHKNIDDFLRYAKKKDFNISILTNATLIKDDQIKLIKDLEVSLVQVSVYSMNPDIHDVITKLPGSHKKTISTIEKMVKSDIPVQISCPVMKINREGYKDVLQWANGLKMKAYTDFIMMGKTDGTDDNLSQRIDIEETKLLLKDMMDFDKDYIDMMDTKAPPSRDLDKYAEEAVCGVGISTLCMIADGNLYPCAGWQGYLVGNVNEAPLLDIWKNSERLNKLRNIKHKDFPRCLKCDAIDYCAMCLVRNFNEGGDMMKINEIFCQSAKVNKRVVEEYMSEIKSKK